MASITWTQSDCAFYNDGTESGSTLISSSNITVGDTGSPDKPFDTTILIRAVLQLTGKNDSTSFDVLVSKNGGAYGTRTAISGITAVNSTNLTQGNDTTQRLGAGTFITNNNGVGDQGVTGSVTAVVGEELEVLFSFEIDEADVSDGDYFDFRVYQDGGSTACDVYSETLRVTVQKTITYTGVLFTVDFEEGDLSDLDSYGGTPEVGASYALAGTNYGMRVYADGIGTDEDGVKSLSALATDRLRFRMYFDPVSIAMSSGNNMWICRMQDSVSTNVFILYLGYNGSSYTLDMQYESDSTTFSLGAPVTVTDAEHYVEIFIQRESSDGQADGSLSWWIDGTSQTGFTSVDDFNYFKDLAEFHIGNINVSGTYTGYVYIDEVVVRDDNTQIGPVGGGGTNFTRTITNSLGITDTIALVISFSRTLPESVGVTDTVTTSRSIVKAIADSLGITDTVATARSLYKTISNNVGITDTVSRTILLLASISDSVGITDSLSWTIARRLTLQESVGITDVLTTARSIVKGIADNVGITDVLTTARNLIISIADAVGITDVITVIKGALTKYATISDTVGITDNVTTVRNLKIAFAEALGITDEVFTARSIKKLLEEALGITDTVTGYRKLFVTLVDTIGITDTIATVVTFVAQKVLKTILSTLGIIAVTSSEE